MGRDHLYADIIEAFLESGESLVEVQGTGRRPATLREGLRNELLRRNLSDRIQVRLLSGERVFLGLRQESAEPRGAEGLPFENGFVSISEDEWRRRFPLVLDPRGDEVWDYMNRVAEDLLDAQDPRCVWTYHHDSGDGVGDYIMSGRWRVNRMGYYITELPVPEGLRIQVWDDPWPEEEQEFMRGAVARWQQLAGVDEGSIIEDEFEEWFLENHPQRDELNRDYSAMLTHRLGWSVSLFANRAEYAGEPELPGPTRPVPVRVELDEFDTELSFEECESLLQEFHDSGDAEWFVECPSASTEMSVEAGLREVLQATEWGFLVRSSGSWRDATVHLVRVQESWAEAERTRAEARGWTPDRSPIAAQRERKDARIRKEQELTALIDGLAPPPSWVEVIAELGVQLTRVRFVDECRGWCCGWKSGVMRTDDGGRTWERQLNTGTELDFCDALHGWVWPGESGGLVSTTDGGKTWSALQLPGDEGVENLQLLNPMTGWVLTDHGVVHRTRDGGASWESFDSGRPYDNHSIHFADEHHGYISGDGPVLTATADGGETWADAEGFEGVEPAFLFHTHFIDSEHGWAVGWDGAVASTRDGGATWTTKFLAPPENLLSVFFTSASEGWIVGGYGEEPNIGLLLHTRDGGETWDTYSMPNKECLNDVCFVDASLGWAVGENGSVLRITPPEGT